MTKSTMLFVAFLAAVACAWIALILMTRPPPAPPPEPYAIDDCHETVFRLADEKPSPVLVEQAIDALRKHDGVLIHCTHGQDRTGLAVGIYRVLVDGRTKTDAYDEMRAIGFHPELVGLAEAWRDFDGKDIASIGR